MNQIGTFKDSNEICAIAIGKTSEVFTHCGILYSAQKDGKRKTFFLHLGNPLYLFNNSDLNSDKHNYFSQYPNFIWKPFKDIPPQLLKLTRTKCEFIADKNKALPYGIFNEEDTYFDAEGNFILGTDSSGLTCASFVKVVLKGSNIDVLDDTDWPEDRDEDLQWLNHLIDEYSKYLSNIQKEVETIENEIKILKKNSNIEAQTKSRIFQSISIKKQEHIKIFKKVIQELNEGRDFNFKRYRPEEISAACFNSFKLFPIKCHYNVPNSLGIGAELMGIELKNQLT